MVKMKLACDFETTVYEGQDHTEVWSAAYTEIYEDNANITERYGVICHSINEFFEKLKNMKCDIECYFHNLKFDGYFILDYLFKNGYKQIPFNEWQNKKSMSKDFTYLVSDNGLWYMMCIKIGRYIITIKDSLKLLPFSLEVIGKALNTEHRKLSMEYDGYRYAGCPIDKDEEQYILNDVYVLAEALEFMFNRGLTRMTIGSNCMKEFKATIRNNGAYSQKEQFPDLTQMQVPIKIMFKANTYISAFDYIQKAYSGGWCYVKKGYEHTVQYNGLTADVNSLYPSMMHSLSGNKYPVGFPKWFIGTIPDQAKDTCFFVRIRCSFHLKKGYLPFIHIRKDVRYKANENLESSDIIVEGKKIDSVTLGNTVISNIVEMTLTDCEYYLFLKHYDVENLEILDGCYFRSVVGLFDDYINYWYDIKKNTKDKGMRTLAKLFLNNLYGKFATTTNSSFKIYNDNIFDVSTVKDNSKKAGYIAIGAYITAYARRFTISAAQANYDAFRYADTDSIHCVCNPADLVDVPISQSDMCAWKLETYWDKAIFVRQKTYIEHVTHEDMQKIDIPYNLIKCAGMGNRCKELLSASLEGTPEMCKPLTADEKTFLYWQDGTPIKRDYTDFKVGLTVPSKLMPKKIDGGIILTTTTFKLREGVFI